MNVLKEELLECRQYAKDGLEIAQKSFHELENVLNTEKEELRSIERKQDSIKRIKNDRQVRQQIRDIEDFERTLTQVADNLNELKQRMEDFSIVLYGRTMAGKSTLMEILTHGNGDSIGKGAQRTTLDVRPYEWNGLKVFDVPGTCSFGGTTDDKTAFEAAKSADMAIFLLTDDAPQSEEAERLGELRKLGKPVLGIVNVKSNLNPDSVGAKRKIELKAIEKKINEKGRLEEIVNQFREFASKDGYDFSDINFVSTHLKAAFLSQPERENDPELYELSNFAAVEDFILEKFRKDGRFIRIKTFVDSVGRPMQNAIAKIYEHSGQTVNNFWSFDEKITELRKWHDKFFNQTQSRYENFIDGIENQLDQGVEYIVSNYYDSSKAGEYWKEYVERLNINRKSQEFIEKISSEATRKMRSLSDELMNDLCYTNSMYIEDQIEMSDISDSQSAALIVAPLLAFTPVGWVGAAVFGLGALIFGDSKEEKIRKAKKELREKLSPSKKQILSAVSESVLKFMNDKILNEQVRGFEEILFNMRDMCTNLAYAQNKMAEAINAEYREINLKLLFEAIKYSGNNTNELDDVMTARIVGEKIIVFSTREIPYHVRMGVKDLIQEKIISFKCSKDDYWSDVGEVLENKILQQGFYFDKFFEEEWGLMYTISFDNKSILKAEQIQLAQQLFDSPVR